MLRKLLIAFALWWFLLTSLISYRSLTLATDASIKIQLGLVLYAVSVLVFIAVGSYYFLRREE